MLCYLILRSDGLTINGSQSTNGEPLVSRWIPAVPTKRHRNPVLLNRPLLRSAVPTYFAANGAIGSGALGGFIFYAAVIDKPSAPPPGPKPYQSTPPVPPPKPAWVRPDSAPNGQPWPTTAAYVRGYQQLHSGGLSTVTVDNSQNDSDVFVKLVSLDGPNAYPVRVFLFQRMAPSRYGRLILADMTFVIVISVVARCRGRRLSTSRTPTQRGINTAISQ